MIKKNVFNIKLFSFLLIFLVVIEPCYSITIDPTTSANTTKHTNTIDDEKSQTITDINITTTNKPSDAHEKNSNEHEVQYVICEISSRNLTWENASCDDDMADDVFCIPSDHECVNFGDNVHPCNMTCWYEYTIMISQCPALSIETKESINLTKFFVDGVLKLVLAILGMIGNIVAILVLRRPSMRNPFNYLLIALAVIDIAYLFFEILRCLAERFELGNHYYNIQYGYMSYPLRHISQSASVFMTIAITFERYCAVHHPINYNQSMNNEILARRRLVRYLTPVLVLAILYNINRFFEAELKWEEYCEGGNMNCTYTPYRSATQLRMENETYNVFVLTVRCLVLGLFPLMILGFLNSKIYKDVQERRARNVPIGSSSMSNGHRPTSRAYTTIGIPLAKHDSPDSGRMSKLSQLKYTMSLKKYRNKSQLPRKIDGLSNSPKKNGVKTTLVMEELEPLRNMKNQRQNDYVQHGVEVATVDNAKKIEFDKAKNGSPLNIKKVFGRNKKSKLKNKLIPELIETPPSVNSTSNDHSKYMSHLSAAAVLSMQSNVPHMQQNEEIHTSPEYTETSFPIESTITPTESFEKDQTQQDELGSSLPKSLPEMSSFDEDFSDIRSLGANENGSITSKSSYAKNGRRKSGIYTSNHKSKTIIKDSYKISQTKTNGVAGNHVPCSNNSSISSKATESNETRSRAMTKTSFLDSEGSGTIKKSRTFSKSLKIPVPSRSGATSSTDLVPSPMKHILRSSEEKRITKESGRSKPAFSRTQRRKHEDHLAMIFLGFIFVFLLCHLPRILLDIHELVTREHYINCFKFGHRDFPAYISISIFISHVMLVISSATNLLIYCSLSSTYRKEVRDFFAQTYTSIKESIYKS